MAAMSRHVHERAEVWICNDSNVLGRALADYVVCLSESAIRERKSFSVFLSGGSLITTSLRKLTEEPYVGKIDWSKWHVFTAEERVVPLDDNSGSTDSYEGLLSNVPSAQVYAIDDKRSAGAAVVDYQAVLTNLARTDVLPLAQTGNIYPRFDLILVGFEPGPNGNIHPISFSLFRHPLVQKTSSETVWKSSFEFGTLPIEDSLSERTAFTLPVINSGANVTFLGTGKGNPAEMTAILFRNSPFGDFPAEMVAPCTGNLVWFRQTCRQMEVPRVPLGISAEVRNLLTEYRLSRSDGLRDATFYWQEQLGRIHRPKLAEVEKRLEMIPVNSDQRKVLLDHARDGLESEALWNWEKAASHYSAILKFEVIQQYLAISSRSDFEAMRRCMATPNFEVVYESYEWLITWASVPCLFWMQFVAQGDFGCSQKCDMETKFRLSSCRKLWERLQKLWPLGSETQTALGNHGALTLLDHVQHLTDPTKRKEGQAIAVGRFSSLFQTESEHLVGTFGRMCLHLNHNYRWAWRVAKADQWLKTARDHLNTDRDEYDRYPLEVEQARRFSETGNPKMAIETLDVVRRKIRLLRKCQARHPAELEKSRALRVLESTLGAIVSLYHDGSTPRGAGDKLKVLEQEMSMEGLSDHERRRILLSMASCHVNLFFESKPEERRVGRNCIAHLNNAISHYQEALLVSSQPGWSAVDRLQDLVDLGRQLSFRVVVPFERQVLDKPLALDSEEWRRALEFYLEQWNIAWAVLQRCLELAGRLLHACWDPLCVDPNWGGYRVSENMCELLGSKRHLALRLFLKHLLPQGEEEQMAVQKGAVVLKGARFDQLQEFSIRYFGTDCSPGQICFHKLICCERGRARTLLLEGRSLLTEAARDYFLKFVLDDEFATKSLLSSISACGPDSVFISFDYIRSSPKTISIAVHEQHWETPDHVKDLVCEIEVDRESTEVALGILQKTLDLLSCITWREAVVGKNSNEVDKILAAQVEHNSKLLDDQLEQLFDILFGTGIAQILKPEQKLIFCASGDLTGIPFPILRNRQRGRYLFQDHTISVTPSLRMLYPCSQRYEFLQGQELVAGDAAGVVIADPRYPGEGITLRKPRWPRLIESDEEANAICDLFPGQVKKLKRGQATVPNLLKMAQLPSKKSRFQGFIHVIAHAEVNEDHPKGVLVLSDGSSASDGSVDDDPDSSLCGEVDVDGLQNVQGVADPASTFGEVGAGVFTDSGVYRDSGVYKDLGTSSSAADNAMEISADQIVKCNFEWRAALVVLSACDSVTGKITQEGVHNLPRAFMIGGVPCVVASQWPVSDKIAPKLMKVFYRHLSKGEDVATALRLAMCQMLEERHCLYDFAPFLVWGFPNVRLPKEMRSDDDRQGPRCATPTPQREFGTGGILVYQFGTNLVA